VQVSTIEAVGIVLAMRFLPVARIVVLDADAEHRASTCASLTELGLLQVVQAATLKEAQQLGQEHPVDLCVVHARGFEARATDDGKKIFPNPFVHNGTPAILLSADTSRSATQEAAASGYVAIVALPLMPRLLYRRIGSVLQKARRTGQAAHKTSQLTDD